MVTSCKKKRDRPPFPNFEFHVQRNTVNCIICMKIIRITDFIKYDYLHKMRKKIQLTVCVDHDHATTTTQPQPQPQQHFFKNTKGNTKKLRSGHRDIYGQHWYLWVYFFGYTNGVSMTTSGCLSAKFYDFMILWFDDWHHKVTKNAPNPDSISNSIFLLYRDPHLYR